MSDTTLMAEGILGRGEKLLRPFCAGCLSGQHLVGSNNDDCHLLGAGYELSVGDRYWAIRENEVAALAIPTEADSAGKTPAVTIHPAEVIIIRTREVIELPPNMKGRLSLRAKWAQKFLIFSGGLIDPGYRGPLFMPVGNVGGANVEIHYGERMWTAEFVETGPTTKPGDHVPLDLPTSRFPPPTVEPIDYHPRRLSERIRKLEDAIRAQDTKLQAIDRDSSAARASVQTAENVIKSLVGAIVAGAVAGLGAGAALAGLQTHPITSADLPQLAIVVVLVFALIYLTLWMFGRPRRPG